MEREEARRLQIYFRRQLIIPRYQDIHHHPSIYHYSFSTFLTLCFCPQLKKKTQFEALSRFLFPPGSWSCTLGIRRNYYDKMCEDGV